MYWKEKWDFVESIEYEYKFAGRYGAKGEKRQKKKKATPEQIRRQNQSNREKKMRRLIKANFRKGDIWACLKYPKGTRKKPGEVGKDVAGFLRRMRTGYKKHGTALKFICRKEIGRRGGIHIHILVNRLKGRGGTDELLQECWIHGRVNYENIHDCGGYTRLAEYIVKQPDEVVAGQLSLFDDKERKELLRYSTSRNLLRPQPERKEYRNRTVRRIVEEVRRGDGPQPTPGYFIDRGSVYLGVNPYTGYSCLRYTEYRIKDGKEGPPWTW